MPDLHELLRARMQQVIRVLSDLADIAGVLCFGSYAAGTFDEHSDVDLYAFCDPAIVAASVRREVFQRMDNVTGLEVNCGDPAWDNQWCPQTDRFRLQGIAIDVAWNTVDWISAVVRKVVKEGCVSMSELRFRPYAMLGLLDTSVVLYDPRSVLRGLKSQLRPYPLTLKEALLSANLPVVRDSLAELRDCVRRGIGNTAFHFHLGRILDAFGGILFALNERYDPATKRVEAIYSTFAIVPEHFLERYGRLLQLPLTDEGRGTVVLEIEGILRDLEGLIARVAR